MATMRTAHAFRMSTSGSFVLRATVGMASLYTILYYPYAPGTLPNRWLQSYLDGIAGASAWLISFMDRSTTAKGDYILGSFPLRIVLDCGGLDVIAMFAAAVLAFPTSVPSKLVGIIAGSLALWLVNITRIVALYGVGTLAPDWFAVMHEEVMQVGLLMATVIVFLVFLRCALGSEPGDAPLTRSTP